MFTKQQHRTGFICLVLVLGTALLYWPVANFDFISLDDTVYVVNNFHINGGLNWHELAWCFQAGHAGNWHPLTWISHALDCQLFGLRPGWHHAVNVAIHAANSVLLFLILRRMTGAFWRSSVVAALFAWHPLHVESVAWIAERKDVLSTLFWMLTLWAYLNYAAKRGAGRYFLVLLLFAFGLMAKPMLVTLPFVLLLLDWWPLNRLRLNTAKEAQTGSSGEECDWLTKPSRYTRMTGRCSLRVQIGRDAVQFGKDVLLLLRGVRNKAAWDIHDPSVGAESVASLIVEKIPFFLLAIACGVLTMVAQHRSEAIASLTDLPLKARMINVVVSYLHYLEKIVCPVQLSILYRFAVIWPMWEIVLAVVTFVAVIALFAWRQAAGPYLLFGWLWFLGTLVPVIGLVQVGTQAMADRYAYIPSIGIFMVLCWGAYDMVENQPYYRVFLSVFSIIILTAFVLVSSKQIQFWKNSGTLFTRAMEVTPDDFVARVNFVDYLAATHQLAAAREQAEAAVRLEPNDAITHSALGRVLVLEGKPDQAVVELRRAISLRFVPSDAVQLAMALAQQGRTKDAIAEYRTILGSNPDLSDALNNLAWILATSPHSEFRNGPEAVQLASRACALTHDSQPLMIGTLAAACAEAGRFDDAVIIAQKAHDVAAAQGKGGVAARNLELLQLYRSHRAYTEEK